MHSLSTINRISMQKNTTHLNYPDRQPENAIIIYPASWFYRICRNLPLPDYQPDIPAKNTQPCWIIRTSNLKMMLSDIRHRNFTLHDYQPDIPKRHNPIIKFPDRTIRWTNIRCIARPLPYIERCLTCEFFALFVRCKDNIIQGSKDYNAILPLLLSASLYVYLCLRGPHRTSSNLYC